MRSLRCDLVGLAAISLTAFARACTRKIVQNPARGKLGTLTWRPAQPLTPEAASSDHPGKAVSGITSAAVGLTSGGKPVSELSRKHEAQLDALAAPHCREIIVETASTRGDRPKMHEALDRL